MLICSALEPSELVVAVFTPETVRLRRVIRWIIRVRQIIRHDLIIVEGQSARLYPPVFPSILTDFEDGLSVSDIYNPSLV